MLDNVITWIVAIIAALLAAWGGLQKRQASKAEKKAKEYEAKADQAMIQEIVTKLASDVKDELAVKKYEIDKNQKTAEMTIVEAKTDEDVIKIANDIVSRFNSR